MESVNWQANAAAIFLFSLIALVAIYLVGQVRLRGKYSYWEYFLYSMAYAFARVVWRVKVHAHPSLSEPIEYGAVIVSNHTTSVDPFFIQLAAGRRVHWMVASEYCSHFLFGPFLRVFQVIPTNRGGVDTASTKRAIEMVRQGKWVGMFPEGRLNRSDQPLLPIRPGAGLVALRGGVPLIPVWVSGAPKSPTVWGPVMMRAKVDVYIGEPMPVQAEEGDEAFRQGLHNAMLKVCELGGNSQFQVEFAGKQWLKH